MRASESIKLLGKPAIYPINGLRVEVQINDVKQAYGATRVLVAPIAGSGSVWVMLDSVQLIDNQ